MDEIKKLEEELRIAMITSNIDTLDSLISDSLIFTAPDGNVITKEMDLDAHRTKIQKISQLNPSEQIIKMYNGFAVVSVKMQLEGIYSDMPISGNYRYLRIWAKNNKNWQVISGSVTQIKE